MKNPKKFILASIPFIIAIVIIVGIIGWWVYFEHGTYSDTTSITIQHIKLEVDKMRIKGVTVDSATGFGGFKYEIKDNSLYLKMRYTLVTKKHPYGDFDIAITEDFKEINRVYLQENKVNDTKLIWERRFQINYKMYIGS